MSVIGMCFPVLISLAVICFQSALGFALAHILADGAQSQVFVVECLQLGIDSTLRYTTTPSRLGPCSRTNLLPRH